MESLTNKNILTFNLGVLAVVIVTAFQETAVTVFLM